ASFRLIFRGAVRFVSWDAFRHTASVVPMMRLHMLRKNSKLHVILGGAALQRCDNCIVLNAALAAGGAALAQKRLFPQPVRSYLLQIPKTELLSPARVPEREGPWRLDCATHLFSGKDDWPGSCERIGMILLVTSSVRAAQCAAALNQA